MPDMDWNGEWWAERLDGEDRRIYENLVAMLKSASPDDLPLIARAIYQVGHEAGHELASNLAYED